MRLIMESIVALTPDGKSALRVSGPFQPQNSHLDQPQNFCGGPGFRSDCRTRSLNSVLKSTPSRFVDFIPVMSLKNFNIETLTFQGVFPRGHPRCTQKPTDRLEVVVNKYTPRSNPNPKTGDVSIILLHANGFHKVLDLRWISLIKGTL
jgi:hypothetical protein